MKKKLLVGTLVITNVATLGFILWHFNELSKGFDEAFGY